MTREIPENFQFVSPHQSCPGEEATYWLVVLIHNLKGDIFWACVTVNVVY